MKSKSIAQKLALAFIVSAVLQSIVMWAVLVTGGVIRHSKENSYAIFAEKVMPDNFTMKCTGPLDSAGFIDMIQVCPEMRSRTSHTSLLPHH